MSHYRINTSQITNTVRTGKLDLHGRALYDFPMDLFQFRELYDNLKILDISENKLSILPRQIGLFRNLQELYIEANNIRELPLELLNTQLKSICLGDNPNMDKEILRLYHHAPPMWRSRARDASSIMEYLAKKAQQVDSAASSSNEQPVSVSRHASASRQPSQQQQQQSQQSSLSDHDELDARTRARLAAEEYDREFRQQREQRQNDYPPTSSAYDDDYDKYDQVSPGPAAQRDYNKDYDYNTSSQQQKQQQQPQQLSQPAGGFEYDDRTPLSPLSPQQPLSPPYQQQSQPLASRLNVNINTDAPSRQLPNKDIPSNYNNIPSPTYEKYGQPYFPIGGRKPSTQHDTPFARDIQLKMETRHDVREKQTLPMNNRHQPILTAGAPSAFVNNPQFGRRAIKSPIKFTGVTAPFGTEKDEQPISSSSSSSSNNNNNNYPTTSKRAAPQQQQRAPAPFGTDLSYSQPQARRIADPNTISKSSLQSAPFANEDATRNNNNNQQYGRRQGVRPGGSDSNHIVTGAAAAPYGVGPTSTNTNQYTTSSQSASDHVLVANRLRKEQEQQQKQYEQQQQQSSGSGQGQGQSSSQSQGYRFQSPFARDDQTQQTTQIQRGVSRVHHAGQSDIHNIIFANYDKKGENIPEQQIHRSKGGPHGQQYRGAGRLW